ncbi:hypothetical protein LAZ67_14002769 [Cordylochernes scorpioides]|uniref:PiggyBac transposable element-derived protein domain-containing protein n=1 Tax=Cordylochernes scorpioides TaxID=51811 RepID=A0ABY6L9S2_9ARAC|nr:hypothetical protein LAZ67_14002769 [Cordylochernes scorpioides]
MRLGIISNTVYNSRYRRTWKSWLEPSDRARKVAHYDIMEYRSTPLENGYSPAELLMGRKLRTTLPIAPENLNPKLVDSQALKRKEGRRRKDMKSRYDRRCGATDMEELSEGDTVWITDMRTWGIVKQKASTPRSYMVDTPVGTLRRNRFHLRKGVTVQYPADPSTPTFSSLKKGDVLRTCKKTCTYVFPRDAAERDLGCTGTNCTIDESLLNFRGRCGFKQYIPNKPAKYGIKVFVLADSATYYFLTGKIYIGKDSNYDPNFSVPTNVVLELVKPIENTNRNITTDNWYTSYELAMELKKRNITLATALTVSAPHVYTKAVRLLPLQMCQSTVWLLAFAGGIRLLELEEHELMEFV